MVSIQVRLTLLFIVIVTVVLGISGSYTQYTLSKELEAGSTRLRSGVLTRLQTSLPSALWDLDKTKIDSIDAIAGKTISVTRGSIEDMELSAVAPKGATIKRFEDNNSTIAAYLAGQVELIASGSVVMAVIAEKNPAKVPVLKVKLKDSPVYVGLAKQEPALLDKVNATLEAAKADGSLNRNAEKWLKQPLPADL